MMHPGHQLSYAMWAMVALVLVLVALRLYTRIWIVKFVGAEDYMYAWTGAFFLCFAVFIQISVQYGLGQNFWKLSIDESSNAIFWTYVANSFAITGNAMAKLSMGLFLLRVVQVRWHKTVLWVAVVVTAATSIALTIMLWNQTTPIRASWDPLRTPGTWNLRIQPMSVGLGVWSSICDFFFAIFPWVFTQSLPIPRREKFMLAGGMSLGIIAGACGITRTVVLSRLNVFNYTLNFVPYFAWAGAEIAVAMVCLGIPTLRPLYLKTRGFAGAYSSHGQNSHANELPRFVMYERKTSYLPPPAHDSKFSFSFSQRRTEDNVTKPAPVRQMKSRNDSLEDIISNYQDRDAGVIWIKKEVRVQKDVVEWPLRS
ncbi:uncharacterized protein GGS22DRAFT_176138 [Annulohypoxylon maeteangense]|uniref:uncharacterized protein n=1 Tax=Annulohypoxylon maeteangense TaxID=1927788 RepID=UPI0020080945|nr:uncharacterized protein GGS22DRAFT_176138 [Annulohypoxylon maeteangense]KAI0879980.1 hypothetical protein GGS22DRAFT_176138 [Annulohypoxylon maeteangense]